jgi:RNA polymerase sigma-70 factor (ECF subfamily)
MGSDAGVFDWRSMFHQWGERWMLFARQQAGTQLDPEDLVQDALLHIWKKQSEFASIEPGLVFSQIRLSALARRRAVNRRSDREKAYHELHVESAWFAPEPGLSENLEGCLGQLPQEQQEVIVLRIWAGLSFEEIGRVLEISPNTGASRYRYGLARLKGLMGGDEQ